MSAMLAQNSKFSGSVRVQGDDVRFRATGRKNWYRMTGLRDNGRSWTVKFGRYGSFEIQKRRLLTLDEILGKLVAAANELRARAKAAAEAAKPKTRKQVRADNRKDYQEYLRTRLAGAAA